MLEKFIGTNDPYYYGDLLKELEKEGYVSDHYPELNLVKEE